MPNEVTTSSRAEVQPSQNAVQPPTIALPKGGGAIRGIGEKFAANPVTGSGSITVPIATSPGRGGFGPQLALSYDSGAGNGPFGLGWSLSVPQITRKTDKGLPRYADGIDSDSFILSGTEDLVPCLTQTPAGNWVRMATSARIVGGQTYQIDCYRPRVEGLFARIERWHNTQQPADVFWRAISKENVTTWYGRTAESRITDPADPTRIFSWLICESYDGKGNIIVYHYVGENDQGVDQSQANERNRTRTANRYLKRIVYGNHQPYLPLLAPDQPWPTPPTADAYFFEVVLDYGEQDLLKPQAAGAWHVRSDPFSTYRAGFELRTYRLCQRVLMFHHFPDDPKVGANCLVRATTFTYAQRAEPQAAGNFFYAKLLAVTQCSYQRRSDHSGYISQALPPVEFTYSEAVIQDELRELAIASLEQVPSGLDGARYQWIDLDGEGISGILSEQAGAWFYKRNLSPINWVGHNGSTHLEACFAPAEVVTPQPVLTLANQAQFLDLAGDGRPDVVRFSGAVAGFYERTADAQWAPFVPFTSLPQLDWHDPNLKFIDLNGDGHADILISEHNAFVWHAALGEAGFAAAQRVYQPWDEEQGPHLLLADGSQSIYLADMSGDGLSDLVRIRNGEVCYWPNLGYGRFGAKVSMDNAPWFDHADAFDQRRIRLADIDGSGTTDILYLQHNGVLVYFNQSGNSWQTPHLIAHLPTLDDVTQVQVLDLLGNGTACLVWSSPLPRDRERPLRYLDLMGGQKPHLLIKSTNNLGLETTVQYAPSTQFYLQDQLAGQPWITKLPFPVHCVVKVTVTDKWRQTCFSTTYSYHHGYFDGTEREFRGFGRVEQVDVEDYGRFAAGNVSSPYITPDQTLYQPPVKTVTWFHTGACLEGAQILDHFAHEYFPRWFEDARPGPQGSDEFAENPLPEPDLEPLALTAAEWREALRACKGMTLRQEIYELDVEALTRCEHQPIKLFSAANHNCHIRRLQPRGNNPYAVFHVTESEAITYHYELDLRTETLAPDPRIAHTLNLRVDEYGNIQQTVSVVYPRRQQYTDATLPADAQRLIRHVQGELHLAYSEMRYTTDVIELDSYRLRLPCETLTYELTGLQSKDDSDAKTTDDPIDDRYFTLDELRRYKLSNRYPEGDRIVAEIAYQALPSHATPQKRLIEHTRTLFFAATLDKPLPLGELNALALPYENYKLALTAELLQLVLQEKLTEQVQELLANQHSSGYLSGATLAERFGDQTAGQFWVCSGVAGFNADAAERFYLPDYYTDPFGNRTELVYGAHALFVQSTTDALGNRSAVIEFDCRLLTPCRMQDPNDNLSAVCFDVLGMPTALALLGKGGEGDNLDGFDEAALNPELATRIGFFVAHDYNVDQAQALLGNATARYLYYFGEVIQSDQIVWGQYPPCAAGIVREQHLAQSPNSPVQTAFEYSDGAGNPLVKKVQAEPEQSGEPLRWVASGKTILNNKGKPVKQYEPYFSKGESDRPNHRFEEPVEIGVTPVIYYDAVGRVIRTEAPDGSYSRVDFSPWQVTSFDANDTVLEADNNWFAKKSSAAASVADQRAARLAAEHANTPAITLLDTLGREVITIAYNKVNGRDEKYLTFTKLDTEGKPLWVQDARGNRVMQYVTPPLPAGPHPWDDPANLKPQGVAPCYDIASNLLFQHSMDAGDRWLLNDAAGKPILAWNSRGFRTRATYGALHRPLASFVSGIDPTDPQREIQFEKLVYGEGQPNDKQRNLRGRPYQHFDTAGLVTAAAYDFKGNLLTSTRQLAADYKTTPDWAQNPALAAEQFVTYIRYDALNRPIQIIAPHSSATNPSRISVTQPGYNEAGLLERVAVWLSQAAAPAALLDYAMADQAIVTNINYDAKGQRTLIAYGNGVESRYAYEPETFRLQRLQTTRTSNRALLQDLNYTYDPVGNIMQIDDAAQDRVFHNNQTVQSGGEYHYDALYRLVAASGREHKGNGQQVDWDDRARWEMTLPNNGQALQNFVEIYRYDVVGNILQMIHHQGRDLTQLGAVAWNRRYQYAFASNRLLATSLPGDPDNLPDYTDATGYRATYSYDQHGNMTAMPHLPTMQWNFKDQLQATAQQVVNDGAPVTTWYVYDAAGQRVRKVTENQNGDRSQERIYLGGFEVYRQYRSDAVTLERETLHVMDDKQRVALIETKTVDAQSPLATRHSLVCYQCSNHLGSASLELDEGGQIISYEEYYPYGSTAYQAGGSATEVSQKRYRYTGKERDEETGLYYHGARYYAPWLGRWVSCDPIGIGDGINVYRYSRGNPVLFIDKSGFSAITAPQKHFDAERSIPPLTQAPQPPKPTQKEEPPTLPPENNTQTAPDDIPNGLESPPEPEEEKIDPGQAPLPELDTSWRVEGTFSRAADSYKTLTNSESSFWDKANAALDLGNKLNPLTIADNLLADGIMNAPADAYESGQHLMRGLMRLDRGDYKGSLEDAKEAKDKFESAASSALIFVAPFAGAESKAANIAKQAPTEIRITNAQLDKLLQAAERSGAKWMAADPAAVEAYEGYMQNRKTLSTGRKAWDLLREAFKRRINLSGPVHHYRYPINAYSLEATAPENLYEVTNPGGHHLLHEAFGGYRGMTFGQEWEIQMMFNFLLR